MNRQVPDIEPAQGKLTPFLKQRIKPLVSWCVKGPFQFVFSVPVAIRFIINPWLKFLAILAISSIGGMIFFFTHREDIDPEFGTVAFIIVITLFLFTLSRMHKEHLRVEQDREELKEILRKMAEERSDREELLKKFRGMLEKRGVREELPEELLKEFREMLEELDKK